MKDEALRAQLHRAMDTRLSGLEGDPWLGQRIIGAERKRKPMKKKILAALALCLALLLAFASVAAALNLNVFELLSGWDPRLKDIAAPSAAEGAVPVTVENNKAGKSVFQVTNAYYDGDSLMIGYYIENETYVESFTPTESQLARMEAVSDGVVPMSFSPRDAAFGQALSQAMENHTPCGVMEVRLSLRDHAQAEGSDLGPWSEWGEEGENGLVFSVRDYESLPQALRDRDGLTILLSLGRQTFYVYYDGQRAYTLFENETLPAAVTVTVPRTEAEARRFTGSLDVEGVAATLDVAISAVRATARLIPAAEPFSDIPADLPGGASRWYEMTLTDDSGALWPDEGCRWESDGSITFFMHGLGRLPEGLTARFRVVEDEAAVTEQEVQLTQAQ